MNHFFAYLDRLRLIRRWGLMRNLAPENDMEHSLQTAMIAHGLAAIANSRYGKHIDERTVVTLAIYHDVSEVITGDLPTPVKYKTPEIQDAYRSLESNAKQRLCEMLPDDLRPSFAPWLQPDETSQEWRIVKTADRISAYLKCLEEEKLGNCDFRSAKETILRSIEESPLPEVQDFLREFIPSFSLSPDEISRN